ncbi:hypothetical protein ACFVYP_25615 [Kitasatospora sp. NPDC058201]|uniref:hypothetical protein n=1 Tax=Streptomycetaceae TaxID=2062 RepID=UPI002E7A0D8B|nr:hypothetical protein [Streptomyces sp. BE303]MED7949189.1 hypothetical protein [Streptomyces sp. BE303]
MGAVVRASTDSARPGRTAAVAALAVVVLALSSCGAETIPERRRSTVTLEQAKAQVDTYLAEILARLTVKPTASPADFLDSHCDANDVGPHGRMQTSRGYDFGDVPLASKTEAAAAFRTFLMGKGFEPDPSATADWVKLKNPKDKFLAILDGVSGESHNLSLEVSTPCVWPKGTPPPS